MKVIVYSRPTCIKCKQAKAFLKEKRISFNELNIDEHPDKMQKFIDKGLMELPIIDIDGELIAGYKQTDLKKALNID